MKPRSSGGPAAGCLGRSKHTLTYTDTNTTASAIWLFAAPCGGAESSERCAKEWVVTGVGRGQGRRKGAKDRGEREGRLYEIADWSASTCPLLIANWPSGCWCCANTIARCQHTIWLPCFPSLSLSVYSHASCCPTLSCHWLWVHNPCKTTCKGQILQEEINAPWDRQSGSGESPVNAVHSCCCKWAPFPCS